MRVLLICVVVIVLAIQACAVANCFASATTSGFGGVGTTSPIDTTGASILIVVTTGYGSWPFVSDSSGNAWQTTATYNGGFNNGTYTQIWFAAPPTTNSSHTFTIQDNPGPGGNFPTANVYACSGTHLDHPYARVNGLLNSATAVVFQPGSVSPFETGDLVISAAGTNNLVTTATIDSGFNTPVINNGRSGANESLVSSWISAPDTSALNPTWTTTVTLWSAVNAIFKASTATPPAKSTPYVKTVAGVGAEGYAGDGGSALSAKLDWPAQIVITSLKLICWVDVNNNRIRCLNPTAASITQYGVTIAAGNINTIAGNGTQGFVDNVAPLSAEMGHSVGLAIDSADCMYVADQQSHAIRKFCTTGNMTTIAGRGPGGVLGSCGPQTVAGFAGDGGPATSSLMDCPQGVTVNPAGTVVYAADSNNRRIRAINLDTVTHIVAGVSIPAGDINTVFGSGAGTCGITGSGTTSILGYPLGIKLSAASAIVVADFGCQRAWSLASTGVPALVAGNGTAGYVDGSASSAELNAPFDVEILNSGDILIADANNSAVRMWNHLTNAVSTLAGNLTFYPYTNGTWITGGYSGDGSASRLAGLMFPAGLVKDELGNVYIGDLGNERIRYLYGIGLGGRKTTTGVKVTSGTKMQ